MRKRSALTALFWPSRTGFIISKARRECPLPPSAASLRWGPWQVERTTSKGLQTFFLTILERGWLCSVGRPGGPPVQGQCAECPSLYTISGVAIQGPPSPEKQRPSVVYIALALISSELGSLKSWRLPPPTAHWYAHAGRFINVA